MIYKLVIITVLATSAMTHHYNGWSHDEYSSYAQSDLIWEWHGQAGSVNIQPVRTHENYILGPHQQRQWHDNRHFTNQQPGQVKQVKPNTPNVHPTNSNRVVGSNREAGPQQQAIKGAPRYNKTHNPCTRKIVTPNFNKPGRRISQAKCMSYIWEIKEREDRKILGEECAKYRREYLGIFEYPFIGGRSTEPGEFPHMVAIGWKAIGDGWIFKCGATIISETFVLTAGHCTKSRRDPRISNLVPQIVRIGSKNLQAVKDIYPRDIEIVRIIPHHNYKPPKQYFDIALMQVAKELGFDTNVQPACLWYNLNTNSLGSKASASGWGATQIGGKESTSELQVGDLDIIDNNVCDQLLRPKCNRLWCGLQDHQLCAGKLQGGVDACLGDSGGPLQVKINLHPSLKGKMYYLLGITSFGFGCAQKNSPGVYTRVAGVIDWIEQNVWPNEVTRG